MITRVLLLLILIAWPIIAMAEDPKMWERAIALANEKGFDMTMPPYLREYFKSPPPDKIEGKEVFIPPCVMAELPAGSSKPLIFVRLFLGDIYDDEQGVNSTKGKAWLINHEGILEQSCQWDKEQNPIPIQDGKELTEFRLFTKKMAEWVRNRGIIPIPRE